VKAGLELTPDQQKLWPPLEAAVRDFAKLRIDRANARMNDKQDQSRDAQQPDDPVARLRERADTMATTAAALKKIADAADPLYKTLDDGQKRRLAMLTHRDGHFGGEGWRHRFERDRDLTAAIGTVDSTGIAVTTGIAGRAGSMAAVAMASGSSPASSACVKTHGKAAGFRRLFRLPGVSPMTREYRPGLLDIGRALC